MSERIVDGLEIVQVDEQQRHRGIVTARQREHALEALGQERAIGQAREHVVPCEILDMRLRPLAFGNVAQHAQAHDFLPLVHRLADHFDRHASAVLMQYVALIEKFRPGANVIGDSLVLVLRHEFERVVPDHFLARVAGDRQQRLVDIGENAVRVKEDSFRGGRRELAHAIFAVAHVTLGLDVAGDVGDENERTDLFAIGAKMWDQIDFDVPLLAGGQNQGAHVLHPLPRDRARNVRLDQAPGVLANDLAHGFADDRVDRPAIRIRILAVGEEAMQADALEVGDGRRQIVGEAAQQAIAGAPFA